MIEAPPILTDQEAESSRLEPETNVPRTRQRSVSANTDTGLTRPQPSETAPPGGDQVFEHTSL